MITRLARMRYVRIAGFALGAVAVAGAAVLVTASAAGFNVAFRPAATDHSNTDRSAASETTVASAVCSDFMSHLSSDLKTSQTKLNAAIQTAIGETLADEVKNKDLTQAQADAIKKQLGTKTPCALASGLGNAPKPVANPNVSAYLHQLESAAASALGISDQQLKTDLAQGMTLSQIAAAQHPPVTEALFRARLITNLTPLLDTAVKNKKLTAAQEQAIIKKLQTGPIPFWNPPLHKPPTKVPVSPPSSIA